MPELLTVGPIHSITQNTIYALPSAPCRLFVEGAPTLQQSLTSVFTANVAVVITNGQADLAAPFFRCTSAGPINIRLAPLT